MLVSYKRMELDAIQLASVIHRKGDVFITNDKELKHIKDIKILILEEI